MSLARRLVHGAGLGLVEHVVRAGSLFLTVPLMVKWLGVDNYGYWLTAMSALAYFGLLDMGMSFGTTRFMALAVGAKDRQRQAVVHRLATTYFQRISVIIGIGSCVLFAGMPFLVTAGGHLNKTEALLATIPVGLAMALRFWWRLPQLLLRSWVRYDWLSWSALIRVTAQSACLFLLLPVWGNLILVGVVHALSDVLELTLQKLFARKLPALVQDEEVDEGAVAETRREMTGFTRDIMVGMVGEGIRNNAGPQVMSIVVGLNMVPVYVMGTNLISKLEDVVNALFGGSVLSVFGQYQGAGESERLNLEFRRVTAVTAGFGAAASAGLLVFGKAFMLRWLGPGFDDSFYVMVLLVPAHALLFMQYPATSLLYVLGWQKQLMWLRCGCGVVAAVLSCVFALLWGFKGVAIAPALDMAVVYAVILPWMVHRATQIPVFTYVWNTLCWPAIKALLLPLLAAYAMQPWILPDYPHLVACGAIYGLAMSVSLLLCLDKQGRAALFRAIGFA